MYIETSRTYYRGTEQCATRARFLLLLQPEKATIGETCARENTYAVVRKVALRHLRTGLGSNCVARLCGRMNR